MDKTETATITSIDGQSTKEDINANSEPIPFTGQAIIDPDQTTQGQDLSETDSFLTDYDFTTDSFLADNTPADRPIWQEGGELALKLAMVIGLIYIVLRSVLRKWMKGRVMAGKRGVSARRKREG
jgi:hypothetical protein